MSGPGVGRFGKDKRLLASHEDSRVFDAPDAKASHKHLLLLARANDLPNHRLGLVISKKNVRHAVERNRIKRQAREYFRTLSEEEVNMDVVLLARRGLDRLENKDISTILQQQWAKLQTQLRHSNASLN